MNPPASRLVVAVVPDLMDRSRLKRPGLEVRSVDAAQLAGAIDEARAASDDITLVVVDLSRPGILQVVAGLDVAVVGFAPHVDEALLQRAEAAGVTALPRSKFFARWPDVVP